MHNQMGGQRVDSVNTVSRPKPSRHRGIVVALVLFCQTCFALGTVKSIGVFLAELSASIGITATGAGTALGLFSGFINFPSPAVAFINRRWFVRSPRWLIVGGATLAPVGVILGSFANNGIFFCLSMVMSGLGHSLLSVNCCLVLNDLVKTSDFDVLYSVGKSGYAFGMVFVPLIAELLFSLFGWRGAMLIIGGLMGNLIPLTLLIRPLKPSRKGGESDVRDGSAGELARPMLSACSHEADPLRGADQGRGGTTGVTSVREGVNEHSSESGATDVSKLQNELDVNLRVLEQQKDWYLHHIAPTDGNLNEEDSGARIKVIADTTISGRGQMPSLVPQIQLTAKMTPSSEEIELTEKEADEVEDSSAISGRGHTQGIGINGTDSPSINASKGWALRKLHAVRKSEFFADPCINLVVISNFPFGIIYGGWHAFIIPRAVARGSSVPDIFIITCAAAVAYFVGRISSGILSRRYVAAPTLFLVLTVVNMASLLLDVYLHYFIVLVVASFASALSIAGRTILEVLIAKGRVRTELFPVILSAHELLLGIGILFGGYISGLMADAFGSYDASFKMLLVVEMLVFLLMTSSRCGRGTCRRSRAMIEAQAAEISLE